MNFPINLAVNASQQVSQVGNYVYYSSGSAGGADPSLKIKTDGGQEYILLPGQGFNLGTVNFNSLFITNAAGQQTIIGKLLIADGGFFDNRVTGQVEVIDGGMARTLGDVAFMGIGGSAASAGKYSSVHLFNPTADKAIILKRLSASSQAGGSLFVSPVSAAAANLSGNAKSKRVGSATVSNAAIRWDQTAAQYVDRYFVQNIAANAIYDLKFEEPLAIMPGYGVAVWGALAQDINAAFEFYERALSA